MKKTMVIILVAFFMAFCCSCNRVHKTDNIRELSFSVLKIDELSQQHTKSVDNLSAADSVIIILLYPYITEAINDYFGQPTQWALDGSQINFITKLTTDYLYRISITVPTFHGPHNPPYGLETMTFSIKASDVILEEYTHKDVKP